jgi:flagellar hook protein FlgE
LLEQTGNDLHVAINGNGFFISNTDQDGSGEFQLSRAGDFGITSVLNGTTEEAYLTDISGNFVLGWPADAAGAFAATDSVASLEAIRVDSNSTQFDPLATTAAALRAVLPASAPTGTVRSTSIPVVDNAGAVHSMDLQFTKNAAANTWDLAITSPTGTVTAGAAATINFSPAGILVTPTTQSIGLDFGAGGATTVAVDMTGINEFGGDFTVINTTQNGIEVGTLQSVAFDEDGILQGLFSNGQTRALYKLPLASVPNPNELGLRSGTHFALSDAAGDLTLFEADLTNFGSFSPGALEQSTTDIATEFNKMIITQQSYSTAVQAYTAIEEMAQVATQLKQ